MARRRYLHSMISVAGGSVADHFGVNLRPAPERVLWGSDWPHASASAGHQPMPDDAQQIEQLAQWTGDAATLRRVLVDNPAALYGFPQEVTLELS